MNKSTTCKQIRIAKRIELTAATPVSYVECMSKVLVKNRKAHFNYELLEKFEAGIALAGHEVKSLRSGGGNLTGAFVTLQNGELWVKGMNIALYEKSTLDHYEPERPRKLLLRKAEISKIAGALNTKGVTLIPLSVVLKKQKVKVEIALARGKKSLDKRHDLKAKDQKRRIEQAIKNY